MGPQMESFVLFVTFVGVPFRWRGTGQVSVSAADRLALIASSRISVSAA